jgi:hypothetical protein
MLKRPLSSYANCTARAISDGSPAQVFHFVEDAKHDIAAMAKALEWYGEQAEAAARHTIVINPKALEAVVTCLSLDGGGRARSALQTEGK